MKIIIKKIHNPILSFINFQVPLQIIILACNARPAAALRALADSIFDFRFYFISHNHFLYRQTPH
jgi:glutamate racemase